MTHLAPQSWTGRDDSEEGVGPWRWHQAMRAWGGAESAATVLVGFACDAGVRRNHGRAGAAAGPSALRTALANIALHSPLVLRDAGDISDERTGGDSGRGSGGDSGGGGNVDDHLEAIQTQYCRLIEQILRAGSRPIGLGGGHEIAWASWSGLVAALGASWSGRRVGVINFDAHFDLRAGARATSGTPFRQIAEQCQRSGRCFDYFCIGVSRVANSSARVERAKTFGVSYLLDEQLTSSTLDAARRKLAAFLEPLEALYLTFCLDVLPASVAPGVSSPAARGVPLEIVEPLLDDVLASGLLRVADIAELNPRFDVDQRTARVAARLAARIAEAGYPRE